MANKKAGKGTDLKPKAKGPASRIRHGGKAGKDTATDLLEQLFGGLLQNRLVFGLVIAGALGLLVVLTLAHRSNVLETEAAQKDYLVLMSTATPDPTKLEAWLAKHEDAPEAINVRFALIGRYEQLCLDNSDPLMAGKAIEQIDRFVKELPDDPWVTQTGDPLGKADLPLYMARRRSKLEGYETLFSGDFRASFGSPSADDEEPTLEPDPTATPAP